MRFVESHDGKIDRLFLKAFGYNTEQHKQLELNQPEIDTIKKAIEICDTADNKLREYYQDCDMHNSFGGRQFISMRLLMAIVSIYKWYI